MNDHPKNGLHDYEARWLTLFLKMDVAEERQPREAMTRVAQAAIDEMNERWERRWAARERRRKRGAR